ncbi:sigma 54-interacting transcriptional regulator [Bacillus nakamurai]|uniref:AAA family ATPase n=1 Tax=Bacillus nakamurai TaxID=1793963 RepID=A0A150F939_9BACI|nr:sigma 54-interacting transcriptional regulator [Bacillus nakamurai]KXZ21672.1 AAA family ATPase [Bacillus nakamurai]MED1226540.1 sigma 54-interacting transcriptional regulator [Bacillus nakamurai]
MTVIAHTDPFHQLVGEHKSFLEAKRLASQFALSDHPVFITGEVGTGKKQMAAAIHHKSARSSESFITVYCSQSAEQLEHELFSADGALKKAAGGTLFLYEIGDMPLSVQARLLCALDAEPSARIISGSTSLLTEAAADSKFSKDLFYRLNVLSLPLPALSERKSDIPLLLQYVLAKMGHHLHIDPSVYPLFEQHTFNGNVRELQNAACYMAAVSSGGTIYPQDAPPDIRNSLTAKTAKKKEKRLTLMEKEEFLFILESIKDLNTKGEPASRRSISELSKNSSTPLTPQQVRNRLDYLEKVNYVTKGRGRAGTKITLEGLGFLQSLKKQIL